MFAEHVTRDNTHLAVFAQVCLLKKSHNHVNGPWSILMSLKKSSRLDD